MRVAIVGATGNLGTSLTIELGAADNVEEIVAIARRKPTLTLPKVRWEAADVTTDDFLPLFAGVDAVVHLAWKIQPSHEPHLMRETNVTGSRRVFEAAAKAGVSSLVVVSSVGAYSPGPKDRAVDESWPTDGIPTSSYSRDKAAQERLVDRIEAAYPSMRCVRIRPALVFKRESGSEMQRIFLGRLFPSSLLRKHRVPLLPSVPNLVTQAVHASDVARAIHMTLDQEVYGAFNLAAEPVLDIDQLTRTLGARKVPMPRKALRMFVHATWRAHLQPADPGWIDLALEVPLMSAERAKRSLGWEPKVTSTRALLELIDGIAFGHGFPTPPLHSASQPLGNAGEEALSGLCGLKERVRLR